MKSSTTGIVKLLFSILIIYLVHNYFFKLFSLIGIHFKGTAYEIANLFKYILMALLVFIIYHANIRSGKRKYEKHILNNVIYSISCFVFIFVITVLVHNVLKHFGYNIAYGFINYFNKSFSLKFILNFIENVLIIPFLYCIIFPLGFSCIFKRSFTASAASGLVYGILYGISLHTSFQNALVLSITPALVTVMLTYLYKTNNNIWNCVCTYIIYILFGFYLLKYIA